MITIIPTLFIFISQQLLPVTSVHNHDDDDEVDTLFLLIIIIIMQTSTRIYTLYYILEYTGIIFL